MNLVLVVEVLETEQELSTDDCDVRFRKRTRLELFDIREASSVSTWRESGHSERE